MILFITLIVLLVITVLLRVSNWIAPVSKFETSLLWLQFLIVLISTGIKAFELFGLRL